MRIAPLSCAAGLMAGVVSTSAVGQMHEPEGPLVRTDGRFHDVAMQVVLWQMPEAGGDAPFRLPLIVDGPWSLVDPTSLIAEVHSGSTLVERKTAEDFKRPDAVGELDVRVPMTTAVRAPITVTVQGRFAVWSSALDESVAGTIGWPASWPSDARRFLTSEPLIESSNEAIMQAVEATVGPDPRAWGPPLAVAKRLTQAACAQFQSDGAHLVHGPNQTMRGINVDGAVVALQRGGGSEADLVCLVVSVLRAAGIPARPVIGVGSKQSPRRGEFTVWAECFLPEAGWVPIEPDLLRRRGVGTRAITQVWRGFGDCPELDDVVPLCWSFAGDDGGDAYEAWAGWTWARLAPTAPFPLDVETGQFRVGDRVLVTGQANLHSSVQFHTINKGRPKGQIASPWRAADPTPMPTP